MLLRVWIALLALNAMTTQAYEIKLATGNQYAPYADSQLLNGGMITEIVVKAAERIPNSPKVILEYYPWERALDVARKGHVDGTFPFVATEKRLEKFHYSAPILVGQQRYFYNKNAVQKTRGKPDYQGQRICKARGYFIDDVKRYIKPEQSSLEVTQDIASCFKMLQAERVTYVPVVEYVGLHIIHTTEGLSPENFAMTEQPTLDTVYHLLVPKGRRGAQKFIGDFNREMEQMRTSGEIEAIVEKHLQYMIDKVGINGSLE